MGDESIKVIFREKKTFKSLGKKVMYMTDVRKLSRGDYIKVKGSNTLYTIYSFAVNEGFPEGEICLEEVEDIKVIELE